MKTINVESEGEKNDRRHQISLSPPEAEGSLCEHLSGASLRRGEHGRCH